MGEKDGLSYHPRKGGELFSPIPRLPGPANTGSAIFDTQFRNPHVPLWAVATKRPFTLVSATKIPSSFAVPNPINF